MAKVYIAELEKLEVTMGQPYQMAPMPPLVSQNVAIGGASAQSSAFNSATKFVMITTDAVCSVEFGTNPTATTNSWRLPANSTTFFKVVRNDKVAVITNT